MEIRHSRQFKKQYKKLSLGVKDKFKERLALFFKDNNHRQLSVHKLAGKLENLWSMNVTGDVRAIFDKHIDGATLFVAIGSHSELYE